jgi:hypothetical protein
MSIRSSLAIVLVLGFCAAPASSQPAIQIAGGKAFDLGTIPRGTVVERKLTINNTGTDVLELGDIEASCGCTGTMLSRNSIRPGETGTLSITFNSRNFSGKVHKTVAVHSNASNESRLVIEFTAEVLDEILITPAHLWFKDAEVNRKTRLNLTVKNNGKEPLRLTGWRCQLGGLTVIVPAEPIDSGKTVEVFADFSPAKAAPIISDGMFLTTSNPNQPEVFIPIYGNVKEFKFE